MSNSEEIQGRDALSADRPIITVDDVAGLTPEEALLVATSSVSQAFALEGHLANVTMPAYIVDWLVLRVTASMHPGLLDVVENAVPA